MSHQRQVSLFCTYPGTATNTLIYVVFNLLFAVCLALFYRPSAPISIINDVMNYYVWAVIFASVGLFGVYGFVANRWNIIRGFHLFGITIKTFWLIGLILRSIEYPTTIAVTLVLLVLIALQASSYIFFVPRPLREVQR